MIRKAGYLLGIIFLLLFNCTSCSANTKKPVSRTTGSQGISKNSTEVKNSTDVKNSKDVKNSTDNKNSTDDKNNTDSKNNTDNFYLEKDEITNDQKSIKLSKIDDKFWVHTTTIIMNGNEVPANGLIVNSSEGLILINTSWDDKKTEELILFAEKTFQKNISLAIVTHAHADTIGGIHALLTHKIKTISTKQTADLGEAAGYDRPTVEIKKEIKKMDVGDVSLEIYYPGEGHSKDNITVWFPENKLLFGGCFIKSMDAKDIGNVADGNLEQWPISLEKLVKRYPDVQTVIPGHYSWGGKELFDHTGELITACRK